MMILDTLSGKFMRNPQELQSCILSSLNLNKLMSLSNDAALASLFSKGFSYHRLTKNELFQIYGTLPTFNNIEIFEVRLFFEINKKQVDNANAIYLKLRDGRSLLLPMGSAQLKTLFPLFHNFGSYYPLNAKRGKKNRRWKVGFMSDYYSQEVYEHYNLLHSQIIKSILKLISDKQLINLNIIDGGCGTGELLKRFANEMMTELAISEWKGKLNLFGFDYNENNVNKSRNLNQLNSRIETGDLKRTDEVIQRFCKIDKGVPAGDLILADGSTILTLSGSLTRRVLNGFKALKSLQSIIKSGKINYLIGGGLGEPLINHYIAKQLGFKLIPLLPEEQRTFPLRQGTYTKFFAFERMSLNEILQIKRKKLLQNELDLSLSAQPELILEELLKEINSNELVINKNTIINLSFANLNDCTINLLKELIAKAPEAKLVLLHHNQECIDKIIQDNELKAKFLDGQPPKLITDDLYLMSSRTFFHPIAPKEAIEELITMGIDTKTILFQTVGASNVDQVFKLLIDQGLDLNITDSHKMTIAHHAVKAQNLSALQSLSTLPNINWNAVDENGNTPAHLAANNPAALLILASRHEINWHSKNHLNKTPVDLIFEKIISLIPQMLCPKFLDICNVHEETIEIAEVTIFKQVFKLLFNKGVDLHTAAEATKDYDVIDLLNEAINQEDISKSIIADLSL